MKCEQYEFKLEKDMIIAEARGLKTLEIPAAEVLAVRTVDSLIRVADLYLHLAENKPQLDINFYLCLTKFINIKFSDNIIHWPNTYAFLLFNSLNKQVKSPNEFLLEEDDFGGSEVTDNIDYALDDAENTLNNKKAYLEDFVKEAEKLLRKNNIIH